MRTMPADQRRAEDLTARARIRDAALVLFGERGYRGTSIREVARAAGVSPGLVQHHFGSKAGLRDACDVLVLETQRSSLGLQLERQTFDAELVEALYASSQPLLRYLARGLTEGWPGAERIFDQAAEATRDWLSGGWPERFPAGSDAARNAAAVMVSMNLGTIVLHVQLARWLGVDPLARGNQHVAGEAMVEIFSTMGDFFASPTGRSIREALARYREGLAPRAERER